MSLPTAKTAQPSIRSFFQSQPPKYAPPPGSIPQQQPPAPSPPAPPPPPAAAKQPVSPAAAPATLPPLPSTLPREASIRFVQPQDINALRRINALLLPVPYKDDFYAGTTDPAQWGNTSRVITWQHDGEDAKIVGGVVALVQPDARGEQTLYIRSLCLLSPFRGFGLISAAVDNIAKTVLRSQELNAKNVSAHVWTENEEGLKWYESRDFQRNGKEPIAGYYRKLRPDTAWLVERDINAFATSSTTSGGTSSSSTRPVEASPTAAIVNLPPMSNGNGPPKTTATRPPPSRTASGQSYQNKRADMEWNDLPADMASPNLLVPKKGASEPGSETSSRSSSGVRKKRDRSYPAAAFGAAK